MEVSAMLVATMVLLTLGCRGEKILAWAEGGKAA